MGWCLLWQSRLLKSEWLADVGAGFVLGKGKVGDELQYRQLVYCVLIVGAADLLCLDLGYLALSGLLWDHQGDAGGKAVQEVLLTHWADLAVAEEAGHRDWAEQVS